MSSFLIWTSWNIIRYIIIGIFIFIANKNNVTEIDGYKPYCCDCYFISKNATAHGLSTSKRFDLSYCIPQCTDCNYCETYFNYSATEAFTYDVKNQTNPNNCPVDNYTNIYSLFNIHWYKETGCIGDYVSITSMYLFAKSYQTYGVGALIVVGLYVLCFNIVSAIYSIKSSDLSESFFRWLWMYNLIVTEVCAYLVFKPFQYYHHDFYVGSLNKHVICEVDSINNPTEHILKFAIIISSPMVLTHLFWMIGHGICCFKKKIIYWINNRKDNCNNRRRTVSISMQDNRHIQNNNNNNKYSIMSDVLSSNGDIPKCECCWGIVSAVVFTVMFLFFCVLIYVVCDMFYYGGNTFNNRQKMIIIVVYSLLILSLVDSPWFWRKVIAFCRSKLRTHQQNNMIIN